MNVLLTKALRDVTQRKLRALLTILGIAIGVIGLTAINVASGQLQASISFISASGAQPDITFATEPTRAPIAQALAQQPNVKTTQAETTASGKWLAPNGHFSLALVGFADLHQINIGRFQLRQGGYPAAGEVLLEGSDSALAPIGVGDYIAVRLVGHTVRLRVAGLTRTQGLATATSSQTATAYMRDADLQALLGVQGDNTFLTQLDDYSQREATAHQLGEVFAAQHVRLLGVSVGRPTESGQQVINGLFSILGVLSIIATLLSAFLLLSTITTLIGEQTPIIGAMKAIGGVSSQILGSYLVLVAIYGVIGTIVGMGLGIAVGIALFGVFASIFTLDTTPLALTPTIVITALCVGIVVPLLAALWPIARGVRITVRQALSGYGIAATTTGAWQAISQRLFGFAPQMTQLGARGLFRQRTRALLTLAALTLSGAAFLAVQTTAYSFNQTLSSVFNTYNADIYTGLTQPASYTMLQKTLASVNGVNRTEPLEAVPVQTTAGTMLLTGVARNPHLYNRRMLSGRWFTAGDTNAVVLSSDAASKSHLRIGDAITFHTSLATTRWQIVGIAQDYNGVTASGVLLAPIDEVNGFLRLPADYADALLITTHDEHAAAVTTIAGQVDDTLSAAGVQESTRTIQQLKEQNISVFSLIGGLLYLVAVIIALVGAIGLFNTLAMSVLERRREIGVLRSLGATGGQVAQVFLAEGLTLGVLAWLIALIVGIPAAYGFVSLLSALFLPTPFTFNPISLVAMLAFILIVATLASVIPVWGAARIKIAQTLRYE